MKKKKEELFDVDDDDDNLDDTQDDMFSDYSDDDGLGAFDDGGFYNDSQSTMERHSDLLKDLTNFNPFLKSMVAEWLGMVWSSDDEKYMRDPSVEPIMNTIGARWSINFLRTYTRNNNIITNTDHETYKNIMSDVIEVALLNIGTRAEEFGITSDGDILLVSTQLIHATDLILIGTGGVKNYTDLLQATVHRNENVNMQNQNQNMLNYPQPIQQQKKRNIIDQARDMITGGR